MTPRSYAWLCAVAALQACSSTPVTPSAADASPAADSVTVVDTPAASDGPLALPDAPLFDSGEPGDAGPPPGDVPASEMREVTVPQQVVMPGQEITMCREVRLGNSASMLVRRIHVSIPNGSHHVIVYRSRAAEEQLTPVPCRGLSGILSGTAPIFIAQQHESEIAFPDGIGLAVRENQMIRLEEHFINPTSAPIMAGALVRFELARAEGLDVADMMFWGTQSINVPPHSMGRSQYFHAAPADVNVFGLTSHTHEAGVLATIEVASSAMGAGREVHRSTSWAEPPLTRFDPPLQFAQGEGFRLVCNYNNTGTTTLRFGESFYQEMCFMWAYYYPSQGFNVCFDSICQSLRL